MTSDLSLLGITTCNGTECWVGLTQIWVKYGQTQMLG